VRNNKIAYNQNEEKIVVSVIGINWVKRKKPGKVMTLLKSG
jgi:hypothetical protein